MKRLTELIIMSFILAFIGVLPMNAEDYDNTSIDLIAEPKGPPVGPPIGGGDGDPTGVTKQSNEGNIALTFNCGELTVNNAPAGSTIKVLNLKGQHVFSDKLNSSTYRVELVLTNGVYIVVIESGSHILQTSKILQK